jgi:hypothetical protein
MLSPSPRGSGPGQRPGIERRGGGDGLVLAQKDARFIQQCILIGGESLQAGTVLGELDARREGRRCFAPLRLDANDGREVAGGVLVEHADASSGDVVCAVVTFGAKLNGALLIMPEGFSDAQRKQALAQLTDAGLSVRLE